MSTTIKVIEAGQGKAEQAAILSEREVAPDYPMPNVPSCSISNLYYTEVAPIDFSTEHNDKPYALDLPTGAFRFMICRIPPTKQMIAEMNVPEVQTIAQFKQVAMHETPTVDYWYLTKGAVTVIMENGDERDLTAGDCIVMKGGMHAWVNQQGESCELVGVMLGCQ